MLLSYYLLLFGYNRRTNYTKRVCVRKIGVLLLLILFVIIIIVIGFRDENADTSLIPVEDTTEYFGKKENTEDQNDRFKISKEQDEHLVSPSKKKLHVRERNISAADQKPETFTLTDTKTQSHNITVSSQMVILQNNVKPIVIVNLFATWCEPCIGEIPYLNDLQKKHKEDLLVIGILTHDTIAPSELETFMAKNEMKYFVSNSKYNDSFANLLTYTLDLPENFSVPLTVIYVHGKYFTHYEGSVPVEMIEYDLEQAKKQL